MPSRLPRQFPQPAPEILEARFKGQSTESLREDAFHVLSVKKLAKQCNPLACWVEQETPITPEEVQLCLKNGNEALMETPLWTAMLCGGNPITAEENRVRHICKIAYFMRNPITDPISIDVGCPSFGAWAGHLLDDGNHRLAAGILADIPTLNARIGGEEREAKNRGLWNPSLEEQEICRREIAAWEESEKPTKKRRVRPS